MKIFFATDIHGSEICWRKFLNAAAFYKADMVVLGGDVTGKVMVPIVAARLLGSDVRRAAAAAGDQDRARRGPAQDPRPRLLPGDGPGGTRRAERAGRSVDRRFTLEMTRSLDRWLDMADGKLRGGESRASSTAGTTTSGTSTTIIEAVPGRQLRREQGARHRRVLPRLDGLDQPDPWDTFREAPEAVLDTKIDAAVSQIPDMSRAFDFHAPPYGTGLDEAPALDATLRPTHGGAVMKPVGSTAVREAIRKYQPRCRCTGTSTRAGPPRARPDPGHQPGQFLHRRRAAGRGARPEREEGKGRQVHTRERLRLPIPPRPFLTT